MSRVAGSCCCGRKHCLFDTHFCQSIKQSRLNDCYSNFYSFMINRRSKICHVLTGLRFGSCALKLAGDAVCNLPSANLPEIVKTIFRNGDQHFKLHICMGKIENVDPVEKVRVISIGSISNRKIRKFRVLDRFQTLCFVWGFFYFPQFKTSAAWLCHLPCFFSHSENGAVLLCVGGKGLERHPF